MSSLDNQLDISALVEMGFTRERVEQAFNATNNQGIPPAIEWLFTHPVLSEDTTGKTLGDSNDSVPVETNATSSQSETDDNAVDTPTLPAPDNPTSPAMSLKCEDCGKLLRSDIDAQAHAARSGHQNFSESLEEIKPLTAEEKAQQLERLQKRMETRRQERKEVEKKEERSREISRRRTGKEITQAKEEQALKEMKKLADERKKDKLEEKRIRQQLKDDIAKDRAEFKAKQQKTSPAKTTVAEEPRASPVKREYDTCRVQFRLTDGTTMTSSFKATDTLAVARDFITSERSDSSLPFNLMTTFPRQCFSESDMGRTLADLKLVPSSVLVLTKTSPTI